MLAHRRMDGLADVATATRLAIDYQLVTGHTAITLVLERAPGEQLDQLPELRVVPQMLAAGWGGTTAAVRSADRPAPSAPAMPDVEFFHSIAESPAYDSPDTEYDYLDMPAFLRRESDNQPVAPAPAPKAAGPVRRFAAGLAHALRQASGTPRDTATASARRPIDPADALRGELIALLVARFAAEPTLVARLARAELGLSALALELSPALFNWLDEQAERSGCDLESGQFWRDLVDQLCSHAAAGGLRRLLGR
jgi:hypothetical protein